jgi:hypothetical protein
MSKTVVSLHSDVIVVFQVDVELDKKRNFLADAEIRVCGILDVDYSCQSTLPMQP